MTLYPIRTVDFHAEALARIAENESANKAAQGLPFTEASRNFEANTLYHRKALQVASDGMRDLILGLFEGDRLVSATLNGGKYGQYWQLGPSEDRLRRARGKPFIPYAEGMKSNKAIRSLGLLQDTRKLPVQPYLTKRTGQGGWPIWFVTSIASAPGAQIGEDDDA